MNANQPIRVIHMIGSLNIGGSQSLVINLYEAIDKTKIQFDFIVDHPNQLYYADKVRALGARIYFMPTFRGYNLVEVTAAWHNFFREHPEYKVIHSHVRSYAYIFLKIAKKYGLQTIIHSHSTSNGSGVQSLLKVALQLPLRYTADYFIACSVKAGEWLFGKKIVKSDRYITLNNAVDISKYHLDEQMRTQYRKDLKLDGKKIYIHVGRLHPAKNHEFLLKVFAQLHKYNQNAVLLLVGDGELRSQIEKMIQNCGLQDHVMMLGNRSDVAELLNAADCFVFPSKWEGFPLTVAEAQATGLPCFISTAVPKDVAVSDLVHVLSIGEEDVELWARALANCTLSRKNVTEQLKQAMLDVHETAQVMTSLYTKLSRRE